MVFPHPGSGKKVSFSTQKVRESQGVTFLEARMNPVLVFTIWYRSTEQTPLSLRCDLL